MPARARLQRARLIRGAVGAWLVLGDACFGACVPWLLLIATVLFAAGPRLVRAMKAADIHHERRPVRLAGLALQSLIGIYGGFFGAGMGMITLAGLNLLGLTDIRSMNALKNLFTSLCNGIAIVVFVVASAVSWRHAFVMMAGGLIGGFAGGKLGNWLPADRARMIVTAVGTVASGLRSCSALHEISDSQPMLICCAGCSGACGISTPSRSMPHLLQMSRLMIARGG